MLRHDPGPESPEPHPLASSGVPLDGLSRSAEGGMRAWWPDRRPAASRLALFALAYLLGAGFASWAAMLPDTGISIWPPSGLFIATLILADRRTWPWWVMLGLLAELLANLIWFHNPLLVAVSIYGGNALCALTGAALVTQVCPRPVRLETLREVLALVGLGAVAAPILSATVGAATLSLAFGRDFQGSWPLWWVGDATGVLILAPMVLVGGQAWGGMDRASPARLVEAGLVILTLLVVAAISLGGNFPFAFIVMPPLLWAAVRFELKGAVVTLALLAVTTAVFTASGVSPFDGDEGSREQTQVMLHLFLSISALSVLIVAVMARQRGDALRTLRSAYDQLEARVAERTASLSESERRLAAVLDALPIGLALIDRDGRTVVGNGVYDSYIQGVVPSLDEAKHRLWEGTDAEGRTIAPLDYPGARALRGETVWPGQELRFHGDPNRGPVWMRVAALPFRDGEGEVVGATLVIADIDREKRARDALETSETRLRLAQEAAGLGTWEFDLLNETLAWSEQARALMGIGPDEPATLKRLLSRVHPDDRSRVKDEIARLSGPGSGPDHRVEYRVVLPDARLRWLEDQGRVEAGPDGTPRRALGVVRDITDRKRAEEVLAETARLLSRERERLDIALRTGGLGVYEWRLGETSVWWSREAYALYGMDPEAFTPTIESFDALVHPDDREELWRKTSESIADRRTFVHEYRIVRPDGAVRWILNQSQVGLSPQGEVERVTGVAADITDRKTYDQQAQLLMREVNHRSKNMLTLVQAIARQTAASDPKDFQARFEERLRALAANQDLLITSGWKGVGLDRLVDTVLSHFQDLLGRRIFLDGPSVIISASAAQTLGIALHELATNAAKYGALSGTEGEVRVAWSLLTTRAGERRFAITWTERGGPRVGPPDHQGFGTSAIQRMSRLALDADVTFDLAPEGLTWRLDCAVDRVVEGGRPSDADTSRPLGVPAPGRRVLVVEDEALVAWEIASELERAGFAVVGPAATVAQALKLIEEPGCEGAVLDINLGPETSVPVAARLLALGLPFVTVSAYSRDQRPPIFKDAPFLSKPLDRAALAAEVSRWPGLVAPAEPAPMP